MTANYPDSTLAPRSSFGSSELKTLLIEPLLVVGVSAFWLVTLPFVAVSLLCVKLWDTIVALKSGGRSRSNPLILRRGAAAKHIPTPQGSGSTKAAHV